MNLTHKWEVLFKTPGPSRTATLMLLGTWILAAIWGWFFVKPTVLSDSSAAREWVDFAISVFPWLDNIRKLGSAAEKGLFLHSVYFLTLLPPTLISSIIYTRRPESIRINSKETVWGLFFCGGALLLFSGLLIWTMYDYILLPTFGILHRTGSSFALNASTVPVIAPFFVMGFWHLFFGALNFLFVAIGRLTIRD